LNAWAGYVDCVIGVCYGYFCIYFCRSCFVRKNNKLYEDLRMDFLNYFRCFCYSYSVFTSPQGSGVASAAASNIVSNLRSLHSASLLLRADKEELIYEIPRGVNVLELLTQYTANPDGLVWSAYLFIVIDDRWWAGLDLNRSYVGGIVNVRSRLVGRASTVGLFGTFGAEPPPSNDEAYLYTTSDNFVWLYLKDLRDGTAASDNERNKHDG